MTQAISSLQELSGAIGGTVENLQELSGFSNSSPKQNLQYIYGQTYWIGVCSMSWNNLKKLRAKQRIIHCRNFHHRLKIGDHLSESIHLFHLPIGYEAHFKQLKVLAMTISTCGCQDQAANNWWKKIKTYNLGHMLRKGSRIGTEKSLIPCSDATPRAKRVGAN
ncbi:hypothetical protein HYC85_010554 [Camellia sinensis]|uniref:Uncharacterized protein n=1 Tax=Camellia sinensis TaxID=4442 RepID=A0A7J7HI77_CAMSI|nr:hypothetical protein HYC85_010554 [Camellia sinensis]